MVCGPGMMKRTIGVESVESSTVFGDQVSRGVSTGNEHDGRRLPAATMESL